VTRFRRVDGTAAWDPDGANETVALGADERDRVRRNAVSRREVGYR
jgi:hypothetical protein